MAAAFGFSIGDFVAVGKLIGQITVELRENSEASNDYQHLIIELQALNSALGKLHDLKPARHELTNLTSIQAIPLACRISLQDFLDKISKFESTLGPGAFNAVNNRFRGLPRRTQFKVMFKEDIKQLRSALTSNVTAINLLLASQAVNSIAKAEDDRCSIALEQGKLLKEINDQIHQSLAQHEEMKLQLSGHKRALDSLEQKSDDLTQQAKCQNIVLHDTQMTLSRTEGQTRSVLTMATEILALVTSGAMYLRQISQTLRSTLLLCTTFTAEMRAAVAKLLHQFSEIHLALQQLSRVIPPRIYPPNILFTTALGGDPLILDYTLCQHWETFTQLLKVIFLNKPGISRIIAGQHLIMNSQGGRILSQDLWEHEVKQGDHLTMSIVIDKRNGEAPSFTPFDSCPFPTCHASWEHMEKENGGRTCRTCGRWSQLSHVGAASLRHTHSQGLGLQAQATPDEEHTTDRNRDIELFRNIHFRVVFNEGHWRDRCCKVTQVRNKDGAREYYWTCCVCGHMNNYNLHDACSYCT